MVKARKYVVTKRFEGLPKISDFEIVEQELPPIKKGEILVKAEYISVNPYHRFANDTTELPYDQFGFQVGIVLETKNPLFPVGTRVVSHIGWVDHYIGDPNANVDLENNKIYKLPDLNGLPSSYGVGAVGMPGATAYFGFLDVTKPKPGETVVVTGAAGSVGSLVSQIAKIKGCKVIGFAGSDDKVQWLENELGLDKALNYKKVDIAAALKEAAPNGVDIYFDNVGGEISSTIIRHMNVDGRVSVCGSMSSYNEAVLPKASILQPTILFKQLAIKGFLVWRYGERWGEAFTDLTDWISSGQIKLREYVVEGFDKLVDALNEMLLGKNIGQAVVKV